MQPGRRRLLKRAGWLAIRVGTHVEEVGGGLALGLVRVLLGLLLLGVLLGRLLLGCLLLDGLLRAQARGHCQAHPGCDAGAALGALGWWAGGAAQRARAGGAPSEASLATLCWWCRGCGCSVGGVGGAVSAAMSDGEPFSAAKECHPVQSATYEYCKAPTLSDKVLPHLPTRQGSGGRPGFGPPSRHGGR